MPSHYETGTCSKCGQEKVLIRMYGDLVPLEGGGFGLGDAWLCDLCAPFEIEMPPDSWEDRKKIWGRMMTLSRHIKLKQTKTPEIHQKELDELKTAAEIYDADNGPFNPFGGAKVPLKDCIKGRVYKIRCRNLTFGVFDGDKGFIGIREKLGSRYLFTEYHVDGGWGTVSGHIDMGIDIPADIAPKETLGTYDAKSGRDLVWHDDIKNYRFADTGEEAPKYPGVHQTVKTNPKLFKFLEQIQKDHPWDTKDFMEERES